MTQVISVVTTRVKVYSIQLFVI